MSKSCQYPCFYEYVFKEGSITKIQNGGIVIIKKQIIILGIIAILVCVGLSGCNSEQEKDLEMNRTGIPFLPPDFRVSGLTVIDNCQSTYPQLGTAWVNFTVTNHGRAGSANIYCQVYQGILNFQHCGNGNIYNQTRITLIELDNEESKDVSFVFPGIDCTNGTGCYGYNYWID